METIYTCVWPYGVEGVNVVAHTQCRKMMYKLTCPPHRLGDIVKIEKSMIYYPCPLRKYTMSKLI